MKSTKLKMTDLKKESDKLKRFELQSLVQHMKILKTTIPQNLTKEELRTLMRYPELQSQFNKIVPIGKHFLSFYDRLSERDQNLVHKVIMTLKDEGKFGGN